MRPSSSVPDDWLGFFAARGWTPKEIRFLVAEGERHGVRRRCRRWMRLAVRIVTLIIPVSRS